MNSSSFNFQNKLIQSKRKNFIFLQFKLNYKDYLNTTKAVQNNKFKNIKRKFKTFL